MTDEMNRALLAAERLLETFAAEDAAKSELEKYWAGSAFASVCRDYRAGRTRTIKARGRK